MGAIEEAIEQDTIREVWELLDSDESISEQAMYLVAAALEGEAHLFAQAGGATAPQRPGTGEEAEVVPDPVVAFLRTITVAGFRGIGPEARLEFEARPGITVISGRNGSGKSSFAEALEYALTGTSYRWKEKRSAQQWAGAWRNLHSGAARIAADFAMQQAGGGRTLTVGAQWADDADLDEARRWAQVASEKQTGVADLGWEQPLAVYRPLLSYDELGGIFEEGPSGLYDALNRMLGLVAVADAEAALKALIKQLEPHRKAADADRALLKRSLGACDDARAGEVTKLIARKPYDLAAITAITLGSATPQAAAVSALRTCAAVSAPDGIAEAAALRSAVGGVVAASAGATAVAQRRNALLRDALALHADTGDGPCPVCAAGELDGAWRSRVEAELADTDSQLADQRAAQRRLADAERAARDLVAGLAQLRPVDGHALDAVAEWNDAVAAARALPASSTEWADHLTDRLSALAQVGERLRPIAADLASELEDAWAPVAQEVGAWVVAETAAQEQDAALAAAKTASAWLKENAGTLRGRRLAPIVDQARAIWARLRQESDVDLGTIELEGSATRRRAELRGTVDGKPAGTLSVMSQGELHALALALFIPRATAAASPFRFLVLDDPIQAMDPAKVAGFLDVLQDLAAERQVIVFSHDDRLAKAIRNASIPANLIEVVREPGSIVAPKPANTPAHRYIVDATALVRDEALDDVVKRKAVPGIFRLAVEAAAQQRFYAESSRRGVPYDESESRWESALTTQQKVALTVLGDPRGNLGGWKSRRDWRFPTIEICARGVHSGTGDLVGALTDLRRTVDDVLEGR
ncbi:AAA family ATPase [Tsukamurella sp. DT100]|uniref:AAA family ATPase n=1 Tax=Tsukamurella sp. DT100 TaxID=3393415 RepID=UPI003CF2201D